MQNQLMHNIIKRRNTNGVTPFRIYRVCHEKVFQIHMLLTINRLERWDDSSLVVFFDELLNFWRL